MVEYRVSSLNAAKRRSSVDTRTIMAKVNNAKGLNAAKRRSSVDTCAYSRCR